MAKKCTLLASYLALAQTTEGPKSGFLVKMCHFLTILTKIGQKV